MSFVTEVRDHRARRDVETPAIRARAAYIVAHVFDATTNASDIERRLALSGACPFSTQWERDIWIEEIRKAEASQC